MLWRLRWLVLAFMVTGAVAAMATQTPDPPSALQATVALRVQTYAFTSSPDRPLAESTTCSSSIETDRPINRPGRSPSPERNVEQPEIENAALGTPSSFSIGSD